RHDEGPEAIPTATDLRRRANPSPGAERSQWQDGSTLRVGPRPARAIPPPTRRRTKPVVKWLKCTDFMAVEAMPSRTQASRQTKPVGPWIKGAGVSRAVTT